VVLVVIVIFSPSWDDGHVFDRANHLFFCQLQTIVCLWWFLASWLDSFQLKGLVDAFFVFD
ncbi:hypothetical protein, partial [Corynebacterium diphtheriae]|uniref:hypothetical protein n=1 Tax=Corynebacterium diphtheriae TaxID=1717 RepID=UPI001A7E0DC9